MNEAQAKDTLDHDISKIAEKFASESKRPLFRPQVREIADIPTTGLTVANMRLTVRARLMEAAVSQSIAAHNATITFSAEDMARLEEAERAIFAIGAK